MRGGLLRLPHGAIFLCRDPAKAAAAEATGRLLGELVATGDVPDRVSHAFMFTDIVKSTDLVGVIGDEAWENLLAWHDQALRSLFASHGGGVAHHTGDGVLRGLR